MPIGRAIGCSSVERLPSTDTRLLRIRDSDGTVEVCSMTNQWASIVSGTLMPLPKFGMRPVPREAYVLPEVHSYHLCLAKQLPYEPLGFCCAKGDVSLYPVTFSDELRELFTGSTPESAHFRHYIRPFNDAFAFTSVGRSF